MLKIDRKVQKIIESLEFPKKSKNEPKIEVISSIGSLLNAYRLIDGVLYYNSKNGIKQIRKNLNTAALAKIILSHAKNTNKADINKIKVDGKVIWDYTNNI